MSASGARAVATVQIDDASVRVTEWRFAPGTATGWHRHEYAYVVVPLGSRSPRARAPATPSSARVRPTRAPPASSTTSGTRTPSSSCSSRSS